MTNQTVLHEGARVRILFDMIDSDEGGRERVTPSGAIGTVEYHSPECGHLLSFDNGAAGYFDSSELDDKTKCEIIRSAS